MDRLELLGHFEKFMQDACPASTVREIEAGGDFAPLWSAVEESGFLDALMPEAAGGAGLPLADVAPILIACGRFACPVPIGDTMVARALLARLGAAVPSGPVSIVSGHRGGVAAAGLATPLTPRLRAVGDLLSLADAGGTVLCQWDDWDQDAPDDGSSPAEAARRLGALVRAAAIAGAADWLLNASAAYAGERMQFGKPIGRQQALQQQMAVMAEQVVAARMAVELACSGSVSPGVASAATAKIIASIAAPQVAAVAHAVHGAIGISQEYDLHLYTRRLHAWRADHGSEAYWEQRLGAERVGDAVPKTVDWVRGRFG